MKAHWLHGILSRVSAWRPGASPLTKHPPRLTSLGAELPHPIQSPELLGPGPLRRQSAASLWLSHHGFLQLLQHLRRYVCPRSLGSDQFPRGGGLWCGRGSVDSPARGSRQTCRLTAKKARDRSAGPLVSRRQVCPERHRLVVWLAWHTHGFSFLFSVMMLLVVWPGAVEELAWGPISSSCHGNGRRGALWLCQLQWLSVQNGLGPSVFRQALHVGLRFGFLPFPFLSP